MSREEIVERIAATACINLLFINDTLTSIVMDMIEEAKKLGIYKQERKKRLNNLMHEVKLHQNMLDRQAGDEIGAVAEYNEAFSEQIAEFRQKAYEMAKQTIANTGLPYDSYLSYVHQARIVGIAAYTAIGHWTKRMEAASRPYKCSLTLERFRPKKATDRIQQLIVFEFLKYQGRDEDSKEAEKADIDFVRMLADTKMICEIMEGRIKPSWVVEDEKKAEEEARKSLEDEANNIPQECVYE